MTNAVLLTFVISIIVLNYFFTGWFLRYAKVRRITDIPGIRSSHQVPTPRGGGVGFVVFTLLAITVFSLVSGYYGSMGLIGFVAAAGTVALLGWFDDKNDLSRRVRFTVQLAAAVTVVAFIANLHEFYIPSIVSVRIGIAGSLLALLWITGTTNIFNFMDGVDGIASVQAISAATGWVIFGFIWDNVMLVAMNVFVIAALISFLRYNWSPAKIFMGDVGSLFLGFFFAAMPFFAAYSTAEIGVGLAIWLGALLLWPFLFDGSFTILKRLLRGDNIFEAHRSHLYQRLNINGWKHSKISLIYLLFSVKTLFIALVFHFGSEGVRISIVLLLLILSGIFAIYVSSMDIDYEKS